MVLDNPKANALINRPEATSRSAEKQMARHQLEPQSMRRLRNPVCPMSFLLADTGTHPSCLGT